jgi:hypothetical protein
VAWNIFTFLILEAEEATEGANVDLVLVDVNDDIAEDILISRKDCLDDIFFKQQ